MAPFEVNDVVHVEQESKQLDGVVAFLGPVEFTEGDDWVGVRLTGASVGLGKNDGSVQGHRYFSCGPNGGVFVRQSNLGKQTLTRLEELRLKRELAKQQATASTTTATTATTTIATPQGKTHGSSATTPKSVTSSALRAPLLTPSPSTSSAVASKSKKSRLDELRERRAALAEKGSAHSTRSSVSRLQSSSVESSSSSAAAAAADQPTSRSVPEKKDTQQKLQEMESSLEELSQKRKAKEEENSSLQQSLSQAEQNAHDARTKTEEAEETAKEAIEQAAAAATTTISTSIPQQENESAASFEQLNTELQEHLKQKEEELYQATASHKDLMDSLESFTHENRQLRADLEREIQGRASDSTQMTEAKATASVLEHELQALNDTATNRGASDASHYKAQAKLQAELGAARQKVGELESYKFDMDSTVEELTLDKEQLEKEKVYWKKSWKNWKKIWQRMKREKDRFH